MSQSDMIPWLPWLWFVGSYRGKNKFTFRALAWNIDKDTGGKNNKDLI